MSVHVPGKSVLRFARFELDLESAELRKAGRVIHLQGQPFKVLILLATHSGQVVTRQQIQREVWSSDTFVDFEQGLNFCIRQVREALSDDAKQPSYIETLPRRGYRFIAPVERIDQVPEAAPPPTVLPAPPRARSRLLMIGVPAFAVTLLLISAAYAVWARWRQANPSNGRIMLAVLPFENMSGDREQQYLSDGMTEEMITQLGRLHPRLGVIARTSAMRYKGVKKDIGEIGRDLGVNYVVEGSLRLAGGRVRITAQLIQVGDRTHLWAESYDRDLRDILAVQGEVARAIAHQISIHVDTQEREVDSEIYQLYLKGRYFWNKRSGESLKRAVEYFEQAVAKDPNYAPAYAGLADTYTVLGFYSGLPPQSAYSKARAAARRALELDAKLADAHTSMAAIMIDYDWDWPAAEREYQLALELNPSNATAHMWYASCLVPLGRLDEAIMQAKRALELDPLSPLINTSLGLHLYYAHQYPQAVEQHRKAVALDPAMGVAHLNLGRAYEAMGRFPEAIAEFQKAQDLDHQSSSTTAALGHAYAWSGNKDRGRELLTDLRQHAEREFVSAYDVALLYVGLGQKDQALEWLQKAYEERSGRLVSLKVDPRFDDLRADPRFAALGARMGYAGPKERF